MAAPKPGDRVRVTYTGTVGSDGWAVMDRKLWRFPGAITAEALATNPRFPSCDLWLEVRTGYVRDACRETDLDAVTRLWRRALGLWRRHYEADVPRQVRHELNQRRLGDAA